MGTGVALSFGAPETLYCKNICKKCAGQGMPARRTRFSEVGGGTGVALSFGAPEILHSLAYWPAMVAGLKSKTTAIATLVKIKARIKAKPWPFFKCKDI